MIVVDASVLAPALVDDEANGDRARDRLREATLVAPSHVDLEVVAAIRRGLATDQFNDRRAGQALHDLAELPLQRVPYRSLLERIWELRSNVTPYDAAYVALAELLGATLVTSDRRLSRAGGIRCAVDLLS